jgi:PAS domain S-box-containing protein
MSKTRVTAKSKSRRAPAKYAAHSPAAPRSIEARVGKSHQRAEKPATVAEELRRRNLALMAAHEALEGEQRRYHELFELAPNAYVVTTQRGVIREANAAAAALLAVDSGFLVGKPLAVFVSASSLADFRNRMAAVTAAQGIQTWELRLRPRARAEFEAELTISPEWDTRGRARGLRWLIRNITARKDYERAIRDLNTELERRVEERTAQLESVNQKLLEEIEVRVQVEEALVESNLRITTILNSITDAYLAFDSEWRFLDANPNAERMILRRPKQEVLGRVLWEVYPEEAESEITRALKRGLAEQRHILVEAKSVLTGGWLETHIYPSKDGVQVYFRDISERKREEETRARLAAIVESSQDAIVGLTLEGIILSWNAGAEDLFGYSAEEIMGKPVSLLYPPEQLGQFSETVRRIERGERVRRLETQQISKDGRRIEAALTLSPLKDQSGKIIGAAKIARDITSQKRAREAEHFLAEASAVLASSFDYEANLQSAGRLALSFLADYCVVYIVETDESLRRLTRAAAPPAREQLRSESIEHSPDPWVMAVQQVIQSGNPLFISQVAEPGLPALTADAELSRFLRPLDLGSYMVVPMIARGRTLGAIAFGSAASGRRYDATDLAVAVDLARRAANAVDNARLYYDTQVAVRARDQFLSLASHEVRTPLTVILGYTELLRQEVEQSLTSPGSSSGLDREKLLRGLRSIEHSTSRLKLLMNDLLDITRLQGGALSISPERMSLRELLSRVVETVHGEMTQRQRSSSTRLSVETVDDEVWGEWDRVRLEQVLTNLVDNAVKYSPAGGEVQIRLFVENRDGESPGPWAHLLVGDEGIGIPPAELQGIFQPFMRASNAVERQYPGLGIGLAVSREIITRHGGQIWVESKGVDRGSRFHVLLPISRS